MIYIDKQGVSKKRWRCLEVIYLRFFLSELYASLEQAIIWVFNAPEFKEKRETLHL